MYRDSSKLSFWVLRPSEAKQKFHIQLPLLTKPLKNDLNSEYAHQIISLSVEHQPKPQLSYFQQFLHWYGEQTKGYKMVIHPQSLVLLYWNMTIFFTIFLNFIEIPIVLLLCEDSYYQLYQNEAFSIVYYFILVLFIYDMIVVRPRISYDINGRNITKNEDMLRHYLTHFFGIDFLGVLVLIISYFPIRHIDYLRFAFFLKIIPLKEIHRQIKFRLLVKRNASAIYDFFRLTFLIMFITNFCSCIYFAIDYHFYQLKGEFYDMGFLWLNGSYFLYNIDVEQSFGRVGSYIYALYWSMETAGTCGYGIATPKNYYEILYVNFCMLFIEVIFVFFTDGIINLIIAHGERRRKKLGKIKKVVNVSLSLELGGKMKNKLVEYISDLKNTDQEQLQEEMNASLSAVLKNQFNLTFKSHFLNLIDLINLITRNSSDHNLLKVDIANIIRRRQYQQGESIYQIRQVQPQKLILIQRGVCVVENNQLGYRRFQSEWGVIGKREFYFQKIPIYTVTAEEYIQGLQIDRAEFLKCLKRYRDIYQRYRELMDKVLIEKEDTGSLYVKCVFCNMYHLHQVCPVANQWRLDLKIRKITSEEDDVPHPRLARPRRQLRSRKFLNLAGQVCFPERVLRTSSYFRPYNI